MYRRFHGGFREEYRLQEVQMKFIGNVQEFSRRFEGGLEDVRRSFRIGLFQFLRSLEEVLKRV